MNQTIYITTTIPYVNAKPHVGHAFEFVLSDAYARVLRKRNAKVFLQTGTDENAFKNVVAARAAGLETKEFVDRNADKFRDLIRKLDVEADSFIRTTEDRHRKGVEEFWKRLKPEDIFEKSYEGLYCVGCEDFYREEDLVNGECPDHRSKPERVSETNLFFRLSRYQNELLRLIESDKIKISPESKKNEVLQFIGGGLQDISLTRPKSRSGDWGIVVPGVPDQVIYVWIDALINYLSGIGFGESDAWKTLWTEEVRKIHVIGKNVWKFHAIYWPALLLSAGLPLPNEIIVHGFLTVDGQKISKSLGNTIDPTILIERYGSDAVRYYLLQKLPVFQDADFSEARLTASFNGDLANRLGNLYSRLSVLAEKASYSPALSNVNRFPSGESLTISEIGQKAWQIVDEINAQINELKPWELLKSEERKSELHELLSGWFYKFHSAVDWLEPLIPRAAQTIKRELEVGHSKTRVLFPRIHFKGDV